MIKTSISISKIFWSVGDLKFADDILYKTLKITPNKNSSPNFKIYTLIDKTEIITFKEKQKLKIYDSSLHLYLPKTKLLKTINAIKKLNYDYQFTQSKNSDIFTLSCFAPSPNKWCEINLSNYRP